MIALIDNYDSFSYNVYQLVAAYLPEVEVFRNDALTVEELAARGPEAVVLSPGPGRPADAGICEEVVRVLGSTTPILGICLGHQAICEALGATITYAHRVMHGKTSQAELDPACPLFQGIESPATVARYHSLAVDAATLPECLRPVARTADGEVMAVQHVSQPTFGLQFHPESVMTPTGPAMVQNFARLVQDR